MLNLGIEVEAEVGETLLDILRTAGVRLSAPCGGLGLCGGCRVKVHGAVSEPTSAERRLLGDALNRGWRLACQVRVIGDCTVTVPVVKEVPPKARLVRPFKIAPLVKLVPLGRIWRQHPSIEEVVAEAARSAGLDVRSIGLPAIRRLSEILRSGEPVVLAVKGKEVVGASTSLRGYGLAVDIGTTTIAASIRDLSSGALLAEGVALNKQVEFGADVISRVSYAIRGGFEELRVAFTSTINSLARDLADRAGIDLEQVYVVALSGNSVMTHIALGVNPATLGSLPFEPAFRRSIEVNASTLGLDISEQAVAFNLPLMGGYVGGDAVADVLASGLLDYGRALLLDVGTNGEVVLKAGRRLLATSVPAGPAFEGVGLTSGMLAVEGAIESVSLGADLSPKFRVIGGGQPKGICGSGYVDLLAELLRLGLLRRDGRFEPVEGRFRSEDGVLRLPLYEDEEVSIVLTQLDVRKLQLVIAAFKTAVKQLLKAARVDLSDLEKVFVAGAFGQKLDVNNAQEVGLLPPLPEENIVFIGNGSLTGAEMCMLSEEEFERAQEVALKAEVIELPESESFRRTFIGELKLGWD